MHHPPPRWSSNIGMVTCSPYKCSGKAWRLARLATICHRWNYSAGQGGGGGGALVGGGGALVLAEYDVPCILEHRLDGAKLARVLGLGLNSGYEILPCPDKLPHDIEPGQKLARWFGPPYNAWFVGKVVHINKRRTVTENVCVAFSDETYGETTGQFVADKETYGAERLWCLLRQIPVPLDEDSDDSALDDRSLGEVLARARSTAATAPVGSEGQGPSGLGIKRPRTEGGGTGGKRRTVVTDSDDEEVHSLGIEVEPLD